MEFMEVITRIIGVLTKIGTVFGALSIFIEITPIKVNPISWFVCKIGRAFNAELIQRITALEREVTTMKSDGDERDAKESRKEILKFGDELLHGMRHSKENFDRILMCITEYAQYCDSHKAFKNNVTEETTRHILSTYEKCMEEHSFL